MANFLDNVKSTLVQAGQTLQESGKKTAKGMQGAADLAKLNWKLDDAKKDEAKAMEALGRAYYGAHGTENGGEFEKEIVEIRRMIQQRQRLQDEIAKLHQREEKSEEKPQEAESPEPETDHTGDTTQESDGTNGNL